MSNMYGLSESLECSECMENNLKWSTNKYKYVVMKSGIKCQNGGAVKSDIGLP